MIIIQMMGGLGNQMFQYALYCQLKSMGKEVKVDDEAGFKEDKQRNPALAPFGIVYEKATPEEIMKMRDSSPALTAKVRRKLFGRHNHSYFEESKLFMPKIFDWDDIYLEGYWQSEKYFPDAGEQLRTEFGIDRLTNCKAAGHGLSAQIWQYLERIEGTNSVSIHVRRGDYLLPENQALFGNICTDCYYENAMKAITDQYPDCTFYLFSNDTDSGWTDEWLKAHSNGINEIVPIRLPDEKDYEALALMSRCKHNILANSSFSWWASYLNDNPGKTVIAPAKWLNGWDCRDIYRADMLKMGSDMS